MRTATLTMLSAGRAERMPYILRVSLREADVTTVGEIALVRSSWAIATPRSGDGVDLVLFDAVLVVRRQRDGRWLVAIDRSERQRANAG